MKKLSGLVITVILCAAVFAPGLVRGQKQDAQEKFLRAANPINKRYIVVLNDEGFEPIDIPSSPGETAEEREARARQRIEMMEQQVQAKAATLASAHNGAVEHLYQHALKGFSVEFLANEDWGMREGPYYIVAKHSNKCVDVSEESQADGAPIHQWDCWGGDNQAWFVRQAAYGYYYLTARHSGKGLDIAGISQADSAPAIQWFSPGGPNQQFKFVPVGDGYYTIVARHSGKSLDVAFISQDNGARLIQYPWWGGDNQKFRLVAR